MKNTVKLLLLIFIMVLFSCSKESSIDITAENEISGQSLVSKSAVTKSTVPVVDHTGEEVMGASSTIRRNKNGITVNFNSNELIPGNAYTLWFVIFGDEPGPPSSTFAAGHIAGGSGNGNFSAHKSVGENFDHPLTAEVHLALRSHGSAQPGMIPSQIQTMDGGCVPPFFPSGPTLHPDSDEVGYCANIQVAIHPAVD